VLIFGDYHRSSLSPYSFSLLLRSHFSHAFEKEPLSCFMFGIWFADVAGIHVMPVTTTGWQQFQALVSKGAL
jgi:hypothetical protein